MSRGMRVLALTACLLPLANAAMAGDAGNLCITGYQIDHTTIVDDQTILFVMNDHSIYRNRLTAPCSGLKNETNGFTYEPTDPGTDELCSNMMTIRTNTVHNTCLLGAFEKLPKGAKG